MKSVSKIDNLFAASRFILPEHRELYLRIKEEENLVPMPAFEDDELAEFSYQIYASTQRDYAVTVRWWEPVRNDLGTIKEMWGWVQRIDAVHRQIKLVNDEEFRWIDLDMITSVRKS
ncbi:YolD-like family protein [Brevibacillus massiliensis]|uniref:YolD-like family protein n=1 Tax=Brevibacillus massiliensis TaxID=1118054 RepID=UPI000300100D|nr:YolD-like family protein [Brevibacillus massiliensis]